MFLLKILMFHASIFSYFGHVLQENSMYTFLLAETETVQCLIYY